MFIEMIKPRVTDIYQTADRVKLSLSESGIRDRLSLNLTFESQSEFSKFLMEIIEHSRKTFGSSSATDVIGKNGG